MRPALTLANGLDLFAFRAVAADGSTVAVQLIPRVQDPWPPVRLAMSPAEARMLARRLVGLAELADRANAEALSVRVNPGVAA